MPAQHGTVWELFQRFHGRGTVGEQHELFHHRVSLSIEISPAYLKDTDKGTSFITKVHE